MTALPDDEAPAYRLFTSEQAAQRAGDGLTKATFDGLARSGKVKYTRIRRKIRWTDAQIADAVAYCETTGGEEAKVSAPTSRESHSPGSPQRDTVAPFTVRPGSRYATSAR